MRSRHREGSDRRVAIDEIANDRRFITGRWPDARSAPCERSAHDAEAPTAAGSFASVLGCFGARPNKPVAPEHSTSLFLHEPTCRSLCRCHHNHVNIHRDRAMSAPLDDATQVTRCQQPLHLGGVHAFGLRGDAHDPRLEGSLASPLPPTQCHPATLALFVEHTATAWYQSDRRSGCRDSRSPPTQGTQGSAGSSAFGMPSFEEPGSHGVWSKPHMPVAPVCPVWRPAMTGAGLHRVLDLALRLFKPDQDN